MNPLIQHHKASVREFFRNFPHVHGCQPFLLRDRITFWESEIQRMEGMKRTKICPWDVAYSGLNHDCDECHDFTEGDEVIDAMLKPYREAVEWGKEQLK